MNNQSKQQVSAKNIETEIKKIVKTLGTVQLNANKILIKVAIHSFLYKDADIVARTLNSFNEVGGTVRVNAMAYWFKQVAGVDPSFSTKTLAYVCKMYNEEPSELGVSFTYDANHVALLKEEKHAYFRIAPSDNKELKMPSDVEKVTVSAEVQMARALAGGTLSEEQIIAHLAGMLNRVKQQAASTKTKEWLGKYYAQHNLIPEVKADVEELIAEEFKEEELEKLLAE